MIEQFCGLAKVPPCFERSNVRVADLGLIDVADLEPVKDRLHRPRVHPTNQAERKEVLRTFGVAWFDAKVFGRGDGDTCHRYLEHVER